ncbi:MAG: hypothetical protein LBH68_08580 [Bifidobacteriaceae bacterium]|nr:hypothetical protein [Bifidobacteriaceae bacterium]
MFLTRSRARSWLLGAVGLGGAGGGDLAAVGSGDPAEGSGPAAGAAQLATKAATHPTTHNREIRLTVQFWRTPQPHPTTAQAWP